MHKRPCKVCRKWFLPHPRAGARQRICSDPACQRERHRRACTDWHRRNPDYDRENRLRARLAEPGPPAPPARLIPWPAARDAVGLEVLVVLEECFGVPGPPARDAVAPQALVLTGKSGRLAGPAARDAMALAREPP